MAEFQHPSAASGAQRGIFNHRQLGSSRKCTALGVV